MSLVLVYPHVPEGVRHVGLAHQECPLYWERFSQCHEFVKELGQHVCAQELGYSIRVGVAVESTFLPSILYNER